MNKPILIKLTIPGTKSKTPDSIALGKYLPSLSSSYRNCQFFLNDEVTNPDYWFIMDESLDTEKYNIDPANVFFISAESMLIADYVSPGSELFLGQFGGVFSPHFIYLDKTEYTLPFQCWTVDAGYHTGFFDSSDLNYGFMSRNSPPKTKVLSIFCSSKGRSISDHENHRVRYRFVTKLKDHFKDKLDIFGNGINPISPKWKGLCDYKYTITIENQSRNDIITEKLYDSFLAECYPLYYGAPNTDQYFSKDSFSQINIADFKSSIKAIERAIDENLWERNYSQILESKQHCLNKYNWLMRIANICIEKQAKNKMNEVSGPKLTTILSHAHFLSMERKFTKREKLKRKFLKLVFVKR